MGRRASRPRRFRLDEKDGARALLPHLDEEQCRLTEAVSVRSDTLSPRYVLATLAVPLLCFGVPLMFVALLCCHESTDVMNRNTGERLAKKSHGGCVPFCAECRGFEYVHGREVPLHGMNREQRRLTLLAFVFELAQQYSEEPRSNGGGGGDGGGGGG